MSRKPTVAEIANASLPPARGQFGGANPSNVSSGGRYHPEGAPIVKASLMPADGSTSGSTERGGNATPINKLRTMAASGMGETLTLPADLERYARTQPEDPRISPTPHVISVEDVTRGLGLDQADEQRVRGLVTEYGSGGTPQRLGPQRTSFQTRSRLLGAMRTGMRHVPQDTRDQVMRRAQALWTREAAQVAATGPLRGGIRYHLDTTEKSMDGSEMMFVIPFDVLSKGVARGGKYYRRVPTGKADRPWRYYYTRAEYEKDHGAGAHLHGPEIEERRVSGASAEHYAREADKHHEKAAKARDEKTRDYHEERAARFEDLAEKHSQPEQTAMDFTIPMPEATPAAPEPQTPPEPVIEATAPSASATDIIANWKAPEGVTMTRKEMNDGSGGYTITFEVGRGTKKAWGEAHAAGKALRDAIRESGDTSFVWQKKLETTYTDYSGPQFGNQYPSAVVSSFRFYPAESRHAQEVKDPTVKAAREIEEQRARDEEALVREAKDARTKVVEAIAQHAEIVSRGRDVAAMRDAQTQLDAAPKDTYRDFLVSERRQMLERRIAKVEADRGHTEASPEHLAAGYELGKRAVAEGVPGHASLQHAKALLDKFDGGPYGGPVGAVQNEWRRGHADATAEAARAIVPVIPLPEERAIGVAPPGGWTDADKVPEDQQRTVRPKPTPTTLAEATAKVAAMDEIHDAVESGDVERMRAMVAKHGDAPHLSKLIAGLRSYIAHADAHAAKHGPPETPREQAAKETKAAEENGAYINDRASRVEQRGEDVMGSARHAAAVWKSLHEALSSKDAPEMFTRDFLQRQEPLHLVETLQKNPSAATALAAVMGYLALNKFPPKPEIPFLPPGSHYDGDRFASGGGHYGAHGFEYEPSKGPQPTKEEHERKQREGYYWAWNKAKDIVQRGAEDGVDHKQLVGLIKSAYQESMTRWGNRSAATKALIDVHNTLVRNSKTSAMGQANDFAKRIRDKYGSLEAGVTRMGDHAKLLVEGKSMNVAFGTKGEGKGGKKIDLSTVYDTDKMVRRGPASDFRTTKQALDELDKSSGGKYAMRGVQWGKSVTDDEREHHLKSLVDSFADLTDVLGLPASMASFNGRLAVAIGARGRGGALAHYEPGQLAINLTRAKGAGSLAHEWGHFFDNVVAKVAQGGGTHGFASTSYPKDDPVTKSFAALRGSSEMDAFRTRLRSTTDLLQKHGLMDHKEATYWHSGHEVFARCFERYVQRTLEKRGRENTYLVAVRKRAPDDAPHSALHLWPTDSEVDALAPHFDAIFDAFRTSTMLHKALRMMGIPLIAPQFRHLVDRLEIEVPA
jgi:hypothetical protein